MSFDYSTSGLPANEKWEKAVTICNAWLHQNMGMFGEEGINRFMMHQPVSAAKLIMNNCDDWSEESVTLALLGPAKGILLSNPDAQALFGDKAVELMKFIADMAGQSTLPVMPKPEMVRDATRLFLVEGLSTMNDQLIGRARIDKHHPARWKFLKEFEQEFAIVKGQNPAIDKIFADALVESRKALQALDDAASVKKNLKPPAM